MPTVPTPSAADPPVDQLTQARDIIARLLDAATHGVTELDSLSVDAIPDDEAGAEMTDAESFAATHQMRADYEQRAKDAWQAIEDARAFLAPPPDPLAILATLAAAADTAATELAALATADFRWDDSPMMRAEYTAMAATLRASIADARAMLPPQADPPQADPAPMDQDQEDEDEDTSALDLDYTCPQCGHEWSDTWSSAVDDDCPECGLRHISPAAIDGEPT